MFKLNRPAFLFIFPIALFLTSMPLFSSEIWTKYNTNNNRHYIVLDTEEGIRLKYYSQTKGEYQDHLATYTFQSTNEAYDYVRTKFAGFKSERSLYKWEIETNLDEKKNKQLWDADNEWSEEWEARYAQWLQQNVTTDFFTRYNIATDCADAMIGFRWIFSRNNSLPVANTLADTGDLFGQWSMKKEWQNLSKATNWYDDQLFLAALNYVMDMTSTRTIMANDGLPVAITRKGLQAGTFIVSQSDGSGHIRTITENYNSPNELPLYTQSSTSPREVRALYREAFVDQAWPAREKREVLALRWPKKSLLKWSLADRKKDYRYSEEQFDPKLQGQYYSFVQFILGRIQPNYNPSSLVETGTADLVNLTTRRIQIVRDGFAFCQTHDCRPNTAAYEDWSTPSRDSKYVLKFTEVEDLINAFDPMYPGLKNQWTQSLSNTTVDVEGHVLSLTQLRALFVNKQTSYDPRDPILRRWGL